MTQITNPEISGATNEDIVLDTFLDNRSTMDSDDDSSDPIRIIDQETEFFFDDSIKGKLKQFFYKLWNGPTVPEDNPPRRIQVFLKMEEFPERFNKGISKALRITGLILYLSLWFLVCYRILLPYMTIPPGMSNNPDVTVIPLSCQSQSHFWRGKNAACGLNGELCPSFDGDKKEIIFRCPALCDRSSWTYSLIPIGDQRIKYRGYFVGGGEDPDSHAEILTKPYRADSYPCGAAVHAGVVSPFFGGCARISYSNNGELYFPSASGHYGVGESIPFLSFFQSSYFFKKLVSGAGSSGGFSHCYDPRLLVLVINIILGLPIVYLASGATMFWIINFVGFWTICLATDPPYTVNASDHDSFANLLSIGLERFLPSSFILYVLWHSSTKRTLSDPPPDIDAKPSPLSRLILWYPLFWLGVLNNITFDRLPVDRLTILDLKEQAGALIAVTSIITTIGTCAIIQAYKIWLSGRFRKYLVIYVSFILGLVFLGQLPGLTLRIHHYILAMLLIPGCATRGRTALAFQGILLGLFLSGSSRWGLASIAETVDSLKRDDPRGKILPPEFTGFNVTSGILNWKFADDSSMSSIEKTINSKFNGVSLLINDIERYVDERRESLNLIDLFKKSTDLKDSIKNALYQGYKDKDGNILMYLRIGKKVLGSEVYSDFSNAGILKWPSGEFTKPQPGVT